MIQSVYLREVGVHEDVGGERRVSGRVMLVVKAYRKYGTSQRI